MLILASIPILLFSIEVFYTLSPFLSFSQFDLIFGLSKLVAMGLPEVKDIFKDVGATSVLIEF